MTDKEFLENLVYLQDERLEELYQICNECVKDMTNIRNLINQERIRRFTLNHLEKLQMDKNPGEYL